MHAYHSADVYSRTRFLLSFPVSLSLIRPRTRRLIIDALEANWHKFEAKGVRDLGILIDWCSLFQAPRDEDQQRIFGASLKAINQVPTLSPH